MSAAFRWGRRLPRLEGPRVVLRPLTLGDAPDLLAVFGDPEVCRYWSTTALRDLAEAEELVRDVESLFRARELFEWGIAERSGEGVIGTATLFHVTTANRRAEIGFAVGRAHQGRGLASEAVAILIAFAFDSLGLHRLEADVDPRNGPSLRLLERQGFRREGFLRERHFVGGEIQDTVLLGLLRPEWVGRPVTTAAEGARPQPGSP